jgi:hypothetical protein
MAMMAITTSNSIRVNPREKRTGERELSMESPRLKIEAVISIGGWLVPELAEWLATDNLGY